MNEWYDGDEMSMSERYGHEMFTNESDLVMRCLLVKVIWSWDVYEWEWLGDKMFMSESD